VKTVARRVARSSITAVPLALLDLLWQIRPSAQVLTSIHNMAGLERASAALAWLGLALLAVHLIARAARPRIDARVIPAVKLPHLPVPHRRTGATVRSAYAQVAFPLIPRPAARYDEALAAADRLATSQLNEEVAESDEPARGSVRSETSDPQSPTIALLGPLTITGTRKNSRPLRSQTRELLAYLALRPYGAHRDEITEALWPGIAADRARNELWRAMADTRKHLGTSAVLRERGHYQLDLSYVATDLAQLEEKMGRIAETSDPTARLALLESALDLFRDAPLAGADYTWADSEVRRLAATRAGLLQQAAEIRLQMGDPERALAILEQGISADPTNEQLARLALTAEGALGRRAAAFERYDDLARKLDERLGLRPSRETRKLYHLILGQDTSLL
jgi:DNA-binding SARP family transcriptional activator